MNPFEGIASFFLGLIKQGKMEKWYKLAWGCSLAAFLSFWGTWGIVGGNLLAFGHQTGFALASGFFSACVVMAGAVALTIKKQGMWKELGIALPEQLEREIETADARTLKSGSDPEVRKVLE